MPGRVTMDSGISIEEVISKEDTTIIINGLARQKNTLLYIPTNKHDGSSSKYAIKRDRQIIGFLDKPPMTDIARLRLLEDTIEKDALAEIVRLAKSQAEAGKYNEIYLAVFDNQIAISEVYKEVGFLKVFDSETRDATIYRIKVKEDNLPDKV